MTRPWIRVSAGHTGHKPAGVDGTPGQSGGTWVPLTPDLVGAQRRVSLGETFRESSCLVSLTEAGGVQEVHLDGLQRK